MPLPEQEAREVMLRQHLQNRVAAGVDFEEVLSLVKCRQLSGSLSSRQIAQRTAGYSGADMELLCREAAMRPVRRLMSKLEQIALPPPVQAAGGKASRRAVITEPSVNVESLLRADPVTQEDVLRALDSTKRSSDGNMDRLPSASRLSMRSVELSIVSFCDY